MPGVPTLQPEVEGQVAYAYDGTLARTTVSAEVEITFDGAPFANSSLVMQKR